MALKDLLVYLDQTDGTPTRLRLAVDLARRNGSHLTGLYVRQWSPAQLTQRKTAELAGRPLSDMHRLDRGVEAAIDATEQQLRAAMQRLAGRAVETEWRSVEGEPRSVLPQHARYADLCILSANIPAGSTSAGYRFSEEMLFVAGRPVLFIPEGANSQTLGRHVTLAWNSSRAAARAVNDALPILECAEQTSVVCINAAEFIDSHGALPLPQLIEHLKRHGITSQALQVDKVSPESIAAELQSRALALGADLLVAGAYGHARLREILLGGVTRDLLSHMRMPVMMSY